MKKLNDIKILLVTHKPCEIPDCEYLVPIHAGRAVAKAVNKDGKVSLKNLEWLLSNTIGDDTGENISDKNRFYCECSAIYWAWKNYEKIGSPDYIGLMHYRRHFIFNNEYFLNHPRPNVGMATVFESFITKDYLEKIGLNKKNIDEYCQKYDLIATVESEFNKAYYPTCTIKRDYEEYIPGSKLEDYELMCEVIKQDYPEFAQAVDEITSGYSKSMYSMFLMKKELFFEYCDFLFKILFKIEAIRGDFNEYTVNGKRTLGYLAEIMFGIFVKYKEMTGTNLCRLGVTYIDYPEPLSDLKEIVNKKHYYYGKYLLSRSKYLLTLGKYNREKQKVVYKGRKKLYTDAKILKSLLTDI